MALLTDLSTGVDFDVPQFMMEEDGADHGLLEASFWVIYAISTTLFVKIETQYRPFHQPHAAFAAENGV